MLILDKKNNLKMLLVYITAIIMAFCLLLSSPLSPFGQGFSKIDSSVFRTIAMQMDKGYMPYKDTFDHKGPLLYLINFLGLKINSHWGVWLIEFVFMTVNFMVLFFTSKLLNKSYFISFVSIIPSILFLYSLEVYEGFNGGNYAEDYILPFLMISLCLFVDYILNDRVTNVRIAICGMCCACAMMLKFNFAMVWFVFGLIILLNEIKNKNYILK